MDRKLHTGSFEKLLREKADEFRMYPSKRVWHSIYNDLHPGRRWPSVATSIVLILTLLLVGYLNPDNANNAGLRSSQKNITIGQIPGKKTAKVSSFQKTVNDHFTNKVTDNNIRPVDNRSGNALIYSNNLSIAATEPANNRNSYEAGNNMLLTNQVSAGIFEKSRSTISLLKGQKQNNKLYGTVILTANSKQNNLSPVKYTIPAQNMNDFVTVAVQDAQKDILPDEEKDWADEDALYNIPARKKMNDKIGWQVYATPSVAYRKLSNNLIGDEDNTVSTTVGTDQEINNSTRHEPAIGLEAGAAMQYSFSEVIKVKAGFQFNYSGYNIKAFEANHPISTTLTLNDLEMGMPYTVNRTSIYANNYGNLPVTLHNKTYQLSVPVGLELKLVGNNTLQWNIGATLQPTLVMGDNAYLLSSDRRNYINDPSMINKWNLNAGFETFISYKSNGLTWQLGPQFRYQFYSTYGKQYTVAENLTNYGLKIGVSRDLQ